MPKSPHLKKSINQAHLENGTYEQIVSHLERELDLNGLEAPDEMPINTVTQQTESRILGALSKLDEFLLNPQVRTCSVFQGASRNANSESREIHGDRSSTDPYPEGGYFPHHSGQLNSSEADMVTELYPHK